MLTKLHPNLDIELVEYLNMAESSVNRLDGTIQEILEYSRNARLEITKESFDIETMVAQIVEDLKYSADDSLSFQMKIDCEPEIFSDKTRINTLLKNIIGNAFKYRSKDKPAVISFEMTKTQNEIRIKVKDNGEGIPAESIDKIFNMFYRASTTSEGTGLGLYICQEIVNKLNGSIHISSEQGIGTTVLIKLSNK